MTAMPRRDKLLRVFAATSAALMLSHAQAVEVIGTAYTVLYRGPVSSGTPPPGYPYTPPYGRQQPVNAGALRLINGRSGQEIARTGFDPSINGYLFRLPLKADLSQGDVCLVFKNSMGASIAVRDERRDDDGYAFRNPDWEAEVSRNAELTELRAELSSLTKRLATEQSELAKLGADPDTAGTGPCTLGPALPEPLRPVAALPPDEAAGVSGGICAVRWESAFGRANVDPSRLFADANLSGDWDARAKQRQTAAALGDLRLSVSASDSQQLLDAALKGRAFLEHADGVKTLVRLHDHCKAEVVRLTATQNALWAQAREAALQAPQRAKAQCEAKRARLEQIKTTQAKGQSYQAQIEKRLTVLESNTPSTSDTTRIDGKACKDL